MKPVDFIAAIAPAAKACMAKTRIPASFTVAQAALESGWGARAPGNNLFGIKADKSWTGATVLVPTHEVVKGVRVAVSAKFRAYADWQGCMDDHAQFLDHPRYKLAFDHCDDGEEFAKAVAEAGYATDPGYGKLLVTIINGHNLKELDKDEAD